MKPFVFFLISPDSKPRCWHKHEPYYTTIIRCRPIPCLYNPSVSYKPTRTAPIPMIGIGTFVLLRIVNFIYL